MSLENTEQQGKNRDYAELKPYQFKPGQSGNPGGRPKGGESLKEYTKRMLAAMTDEERQEFLKGLPKDKIWEMAEGKAKQDIEHSGEVAAKIISIDE